MPVRRNNRLLQKDLECLFDNRRFLPVEPVSDEADRLPFFLPDELHIIPPPILLFFLPSRQPKGGRMDRLGTVLGATLLATSGVVVFVGCSVSPPNWRHPGPAAYQRRRAEQFDPYPENEPGTAIVGARPRGYQKPPPEVLRARSGPWFWGRR